MAGRKRPSYKMPTDAYSEGDTGTFGSKKVEARNNYRVKNTVCLLRMQSSPQSPDCLLPSVKATQEALPVL
jgi:hypothetical protein